jgi:predicted kinase
MLVVVAGLPGTGKSTIADAIGRQLGMPVLSVDPIEAAIWRSGIAPSSATGLAAYAVAATLAEHQLGLGIGVVVDAVSAVEPAREMWRRAARSAGAELRVLEVICSDERLHRTRLESRRRDIEGFYEPTWEQVQRRRAEHEPWRDDRLVIDTVTDPEAAIRQALAYLAGDQPRSA